MIKFALWPENLKELRNSWGNERDTWLNRSKKSEGYYYNDVEGTGTVYTVEQLKEIRKTLNIESSINFQYSKANQKLALLLKSKPSHRFVARSKQKAMKDYARGIDEMKHNIMYTSKSSKHIKEFAKEVLTLGIGIFRNFEEEFFQEGEIGLAVQHVKNENFIGDANLQEPDSEKMQGYFVEKEITMSEAKRKYQKYVDGVNALYKNSPELRGMPQKLTMEFFAKTTTSMPSDRSSISGFFDKQKIVVREFTDKVYARAYYFKDQKGVINKRFLENELPQNISIIKKNSVSYEDNIFVRETLMLGDYIVDITIKPWLTYPTQLCFFEWGGKLYKTYSMLWFTRGMQEGFDKLIHIMLLNGILSNNPGWEAPYGSIKPEDEVRYETHGNNPMVVKKYKPIVVENQVFKPEKLVPQGLSNFYPTILEMLSNGMNAVTGIWPILEGNASATPVDTLGGLQKFQSAAMDRVMLTLEDISQTLMQSGLSLGEMILNLFEPNRDYLYFDSNGQSLSATLTKKQVNELRLMKYGIASVPAEGHPTLKTAVAVELFKIAQSTPSIEERSYFTNKALGLLDIAEVDEILSDLDTIKNLKSQIQQLLEQNKRNIELMKQSQNAQLNAEKEAALQEALVQTYQRIIRAEEKAMADIKSLPLKEEIDRLKKEKNKTKSLDK